MGGAVSAGENNDELIDNLIEAGYIKNQNVENVFRAVDRADYYLPQHKETSYKDLAWKHGNLHISAPCIYAEVLEALCVESGQSFLNIGSGTGYLSTLVGLLIGPNGMNHGVEFYQDVIDYAEERLHDFKMNNNSFDEFEFCDPVFFQGNGLQLSSSCPLYDRVYVGASCPVEHENYMKNLIKVNGILVMPLNDQLLQITRRSELEWETKQVLPVSFASLIIPQKADITLIDLPLKKPLLLQEICRVEIRRKVSAYIKSNHTIEKQPRPPKKKPAKREVLHDSDMPAVFRHIVLMQRRFQPDELTRSSSDTMSDDDGIDDSFTDDREPDDRIFLQGKCLDTLTEESDPVEAEMEDQVELQPQNKIDDENIDQEDELLQASPNGRRPPGQYSEAISVAYTKRQSSDHCSVSTSSTSGIGSYGSFDPQPETPPSLRSGQCVFEEEDTESEEEVDLFNDIIPNQKDQVNSTGDCGTTWMTEVTKDNNAVYGKESIIPKNGSPDTSMSTEKSEVNMKNSTDCREMEQQESNPGSSSTQSGKILCHDRSHSNEVSDSEKMAECLPSGEHELESRESDCDNGRPEQKSLSSSQWIDSAAYIQFDGDTVEESGESDECSEDSDDMDDEEPKSTTRDEFADDEADDDKEMEEETGEDVSMVAEKKPGMKELMSQYIHTLPIPQALRQYLLHYRT